MEDSPLVIRYRSKFYDLTKFQHKHPGGINTLKGLNNADMDKRFDKAPPHSDAAMYLMKEYEVKAYKETNNNGIHRNENGMMNGHKNGVANGHIESKDINSNSIEHKIDESMEVSERNLQLLFIVCVKFQN